MGNFQGLTSLLKSTSCSPDMVKRISAGMLIVGCVLLVGWSFTFRLSLVTEAQSKMHTPFSLGRQVASLEQMWSDEEAASVQQEWAAMKTRSFTNYDHLVTWVTRMTAQAHTLGLDVRYRIEDTSTPVQGVQEVHRIAMEWSIQSENQVQGYQHLMQFVQALSEDKLTINFESMELTGSGQGVQKMELRIHTFLQQPT